MCVYTLRINKHLYVYVYRHTSIYIYTHTYMHIHRYIHIHTFIYIYRYAWIFRNTQYKNGIRNLSPLKDSLSLASLYY